MKRALYVILSLVMLVNLYSVYSFAEKTDEKDSVIDLFSDYINEEYSLDEEADLQTNVDEEKSSPCNADLDDNFAEGKVLVSIMREQSAARQEYTAADFPGVDVKEISVSMNYYPEINNNMILRIKLNKQDKASVLEAIRVLEQNPIVRSAFPSYIFEVVDNVEAEEYSADTVSPNDVSVYNSEELNSHLYTYACCAKKYTNANMNNAVKVGVMGGGIYNNRDISAKVLKYVDCVNGNAEQYIEPIGVHETIVANAVARNAVSGKSYSHSRCGNNIFTGVCTNVELYSFKTTYMQAGKKYSEAEFYINAINYANDHGIRVLVCSALLKNGYQRDTDFENSVASYNGVIISSASNISNNLYEYADIDASSKIFYPTSCPSDNVIVVGECRRENNAMVLSSDTHYGKTTVDLFAPGTIYDDVSTNCDYTSGASFAAPRVAGAAAVLLNICPTLSKYQLRHYLLAGVDASSNLADKCVTGGSLNVYKSAKMLISDLAVEWKTVFAGHFTRTDKMQVAAYCQVDNIQMKCFVWTYDKANGTFSDPEQWFTNSSYALEYELYGVHNMYRSVAGDFDGNGYTEICTLYDYDNYLFIEGNGYSVHPANHKIYLDVHQFTGRVAALDYDNDGRDEIAALYEEPGVWGHTKLYTWDFSGTGTGMSATQRLCYDSKAGNYCAGYTTDRVVAGDFDGDGADELGAIYYYPETGKYSLHKFDIWTGGASYTNLIYKRNDIDATKVTGRVVKCNYNGGGDDEIVCMYDNSQYRPDGIINYGFRFTSYANTWEAMQLYTSSEGVYDADRSTNLLVSADFRDTGLDDIVAFYKIPIGNIMLERSRLYICKSPDMYGYTSVWDPFN